MIEDYWKQFIEHDYQDVLLKILTVIIISSFSILAGRIIGKKTVHQMTLPNITFVFIFASIMGSLIMQPQHLIIKIILAITLMIFVEIIERLQLKFNELERLVAGLSAVLYSDGKLNKAELKKNKFTVDMLESSLRLRGIPSIEICKTITLESNGFLGVELLSKYEFVKKFQFDKAMKDLFKILDDSKYKEAKLPKFSNTFDETKTKKPVNNDGELE